MKKNVLIYGAQEPRAWATALYFAEREHKVHAVFTNGEPPKADGAIHGCASVADALAQLDSLDLLVLTATAHTPNDGAIGAHSCEQLLHTLDVNVNGCLDAVAACLPLLQRGKGKRIGVLTPENGSVRCGRSMDDYGYLMSCAAVNMAQKILFNKLHPQGFTFRNEYASAEDGLPAGVYMDMDLCYDANDAYIHSDENRLVMRDARYREIAW